LPIWYRREQKNAAKPESAAMWCGRKVQLLELHDDLIDGHILSNLAADLRVYKALVM
jgi:hypothetical protein